MNKELTKERARFKAIVNKAVKREINMGRIKHFSRFEAMKDYIFFEIDNPDYIRQNKV